MLIIFAIRAIVQSQTLDLAFWKTRFSTLPLLFFVGVPDICTALSLSMEIFTTIHIKRNIKEDILMITEDQKCNKASHNFVKQAFVLTLRYLYMRML